MTMLHLNSVSRIRTQTRAGFTLLELVIAASISIVVVLLAYSAIRMAGKAVASMERASIQGTMLRTSFIVVSEQTRLNVDVGTLAPADLSITLPPKNWPIANLQRSGPSSGRIILQNQITGVSSKIDLAMTGARDVP